MYAVYFKLEHRVFPSRAIRFVDFSDCKANVRPKAKKNRSKQGEPPSWRILAPSAALALTLFYLIR